MKTIAGLFFTVVVWVTGVAVPIAFGTRFEVSAIGSNFDIEECADIARSTARALIGSIRTLAGQ
jgi:hypothetical protein